MQCWRAVGVQRVALVCVLLSSIHASTDKWGCGKWAVASFVSEGGFEWVYGEGVLLCVGVRLCAISVSGWCGPLITIKANGSRSTSCMLGRQEQFNLSWLIDSCIGAAVCW